ncbi:MAG: hypothetical protein AAGC60_09225 [Acidobacteriota bacterium]
MKSPARDLPTGRCLAVDAESGDYAFAPMTASALARRIAGRPLSRRPVAYGIAAGDLAEAGWGMIVPHDLDPHIDEALAPLVGRRREETGDALYRRLVHIPGRRAGDLLASLRAGPGRVDPRRLPYYLLFVGDPESVPYGLQHDLAMQHAVGRLDLATPDEYAAYASTVLAAEDAAIRRIDERSMAVFAPRHGDDPVSRVCRDDLARPLADALRPRLGDRLEAIVGDPADRDCFDRLLGAEGPSLLVGVGHALTLRLGRPGRSERQGAVIGAGWGGQQAGPVPRALCFEAEDVGARRLEGQIVVLVGCFTAGTPRGDSYAAPEAAESFGDEATQGVRALGEGAVLDPPFVAALPRRLLAAGALGVIGHVDTAFEHGFRWPEGEPQIGAFRELAEALLDGRRTGLAMEAFGQRALHLGQQLLEATIGRGDRAVDEIYRWIAYHDARSYVLLGDPAARWPRG